MSPRDVLQQAISLHQQGRLADAEPLYRQILAKQPAHFDALHLLGVVRMQQGRGLEALELIEEALKVDPRSARALSNHGLVLFGLGRQDEALESFDRALQLKPTNAETWRNRALALTQLNDPQPDVYTSLGDAEAAAGHLQAAGNAYRRALELYPFYTEARRKLALAAASR